VKNESRLLPSRIVLSVSELHLRAFLYDNPVDKND
jgi:hypothetical protein